jgi:hypothetical protein
MTIEARMVLGDIYITEREMKYKNMLVPCFKVL